MQYDEVQELACAVLGLDYDTLVDEGRENEIDTKIFERFEIDMDQFVDVVEALLPFTPVVDSAFGNQYHAFVNAKEGVMYVKQQVKNEKDEKNG